MLEYDKIARQAPFVRMAPPIPAETNPLHDEYALYHALHVLNRNYQKHDAPSSKNTDASKAENHPCLRCFHIAAANGDWMAGKRLFALYGIDDVCRKINDDGCHANPEHVHFLTDCRKQKPLRMEYALAASEDPDVARGLCRQRFAVNHEPAPSHEGEDAYSSARQKKAAQDWKKTIAACVSQLRAATYKSAFTCPERSSEQLPRLNQRMARTGSASALSFLPKQIKEEEQPKRSHAVPMEITAN